MVDLNRLRVFRSVVATGSMSAAATSLGYTPSAVSQHVQALQRETGLTLLEKAGRGVVPTPQGRALVDRSDELMASMASLDGMVTDLRSGRTGSVVVGTFASAGQHWLPRVAAAVQAEFPDTQLTIGLTDPPATRQRCDIDIRSEDPANPPAPPDGYVALELTIEPYVLLVHRDHPLAGRRSVAAEELAEEQWIRDDIAESTCGRIQANAWRAAGISPRSIVQAADHHGAIAFVAAGLGICVMPRLAAADRPDTVVSLSLVDPTPERRITAYVRDAALNNPAAQRIVELLREVAARASVVD